MRIGVFYYDKFAEFEIVLTLLSLSHDHEIVHLALENREYRSEENQRFLVDATLDETDPLSLDLLLIPGGTPDSMFDNTTLHAFLKTLIDNEKLVAGICGGAVLLAAMGFLHGCRATGNTSGIGMDDPDRKWYEHATLVDGPEGHVVRDGNIITAQGQAFISFSVEVSRALGLCESDEDVRQQLDWFMNRRG